MGLKLKGAYAPCDSSDGARYLVETLWPEGIDTYFLSPYTWVRELAPSYYMKEKAIWDHWSEEEFWEKYEAELQEPQRHVWFQRVVQEAGEGTVTLLHRSHPEEGRIESENTSAYYLKELLQAELNKNPRMSSRFDDLQEKESVGQWANEGGR